jgi:MFS family permease
MFRHVTILRPLRLRVFSLLFLGGFISNLGDWLDYLAVIVLIVYRWHLGVPALAAYSVLVALPGVVISPFAGVWADRWPRRATMITCDLLRAVMVLGLLWAPNIVVVLIIITSKSAVSTFFSPAQQSVIRFTVPENELLAASSLSQLSLQITKVLGPAVGGLIVAIGGIRIAFVCDSVSFLISALSLSLIPYLALRDLTKPEGITPEKPNFWRELRAGFTVIFTRKVLTVAVISMAVTIFIIFTFDSFGVLALQDVGLGPSLLGLAVGSVGLGTALGALVIGQWGYHISEFKTIALGNLIAGIMVSSVGIAILFRIQLFSIIWLATWFFIGIGAAALSVPYQYMLQKESPPQLMGRVFASVSSLQTSLQLLAPLIGALIVEAFSIGVVFSIAGLILAFLGIVLLFIRFRTSTPTTQGTPPLIGEEVEEA